VKLTGAEEENKADIGGSRDQKVSTQQISSFKGDVIFPFSSCDFVVRTFYVLEQSW